MIYLILKIVHLLAFAFGAAASLGNIYIMLAKGPHDLDAPGYTNMLRKMYRLTALGAIIVFWITGILMLLSNGYLVFLTVALNGVLQIKLVLVILLTAIVFYLNLMAGTWARRGGPPSYVPMLHWTGVSLFLLITLFAVAAFR